MKHFKEFNGLDESIATSIGLKKQKTDKYTKSFETSVPGITLHKKMLRKLSRFISARAKTFWSNLWMYGCPDVDMSDYKYAVASEGIEFGLILSYAEQSFDDYGKYGNGQNHAGLFLSKRSYKKAQEKFDSDEEIVDIAVETLMKLCDKKNKDFLGMMNMTPDSKLTIVFESEQLDFLDSLTNYKKLDQIAKKYNYVRYSYGWADSDLNVTFDAK